MEMRIHEGVLKLETVISISKGEEGIPGGTSGKEAACQYRRLKRCRFNPWVGEIPWRRAQQPLQYSCLENPMGRGAWWPRVHRASKSQTRLKWLSIHSCTMVKNLNNKENLAPEFSIRTLLILDATRFPTTLQRNGWVHKQMSPLVLQGTAHPNNCGRELVHGTIPSSDR